MNGLPALSFDGTNHFFNLTDAFTPSTNQVMVAVFRRLDVGVDTVMLGGATATDPYPFWWYNTNVIYTEYDGTFDQHGAVNTDTANFMVTSIVDSSDNVKVNLDGTQYGSTQTTSGRSGNYDYVGLVDTTVHNEGLIGEIIITEYNDTTTIEKLEGYLAHKWGTAWKLPESHPYKTYAP
jgi:hypothetical protein